MGTRASKRDLPVAWKAHKLIYGPLSNGRDADTLPVHILKWPQTVYLIKQRLYEINNACKCMQMLLLLKIGMCFKHED